jgi:hypothetical protein
MLAANANALTAAGMASFAAAELHLAGLTETPDQLELTAADCVAPLLRAAATALELSACLGQENAAGLRDAILDYISAPPPSPIDVTAVRLS